MLRDAATAEAIVDRAIAVNPNLSDAWRIRGWISVYLGQHEHALEQFQYAMRLNPFDPRNYAAEFGLAITLLIFFSWLATNTLGERFKKAKTAYETAREKRRLYHTLDEIRGSTEGVFAGIIDLHRDCRRLAASLDPQRDEQAVRDRHEHDELRLQLVSTILNAAQIDRGNSFCSILLDQPSPSNKSSVAHKQLLESCAKIKSLQNEKKAFVDQMQANWARYTPSGKVSLQDVRKEHRRLDGAYKAILQPFAQIAAREDRSPRHRTADACPSRLAARRVAPLQHGGDPDDRGGGREAAEPRAGKPGH
jgi:hypothetical protein